MSRKFLLIFCGALFALYAWVVAASAFYCAITNRMALFVWPFTQWVTVWQGWHTNWLMPILIVGSGVIGALPLVLVALSMRSHLRRRTIRTLYGTSGWAAPADMERGGISRGRRPL